MYTELREVIVRHKRYVIIALAGATILFVLFKLFYPFADYSNDSYTYIGAAAMNDNVSIRPIGYSKFLRAFSAWSTSDIALTAFQYSLVTLAALYLFLTVIHFFRPGKVVSIVLFVLLLFNPVSLYIGNYIGSDALFAGLSLLWFTHLIWIINKPQPYDILIQALLLLLILTLRYNALYYPFITAVAFVLSRKKWWWRLSGAFTGILVIVLFISFVREQNYKTYGTRLFSAFGGWQLATNALYVYQDVKVDSKDFSQKDKAIDDAMKGFLKVNKMKEFPPLTSSFFLWDDKAPLKQYWFSYMRKYHTSKEDSIKVWNTMGPLFASYGKHIITDYPFSFAKNYLLPNAWAYCYPELEIFLQYNIGMDSVKMPAVDWFRYSTGKIHFFSRRGQTRLLHPFPVIFGVVNLGLIVLAIWIALKGRRYLRKRNYLLSFCLLYFFWIANIGFSVFAAPIVFRYQFFPMLIFIGLGGAITADLIRRKNIEYEK
ncbi:hypothetical protein [Chitinophaga nivalis]|uniref:Glycosyltransferase RgtA/B/C/D-like domain-containing protein n=1 Tax=Chitinophaga nivalis TaxID=2991709 RepID=A0ABT3IH08_9BACT|nr:hypothetical protein [Chitinophaga nivalis]MCW3467254.1 hypothetical protein [Chitinophaga nivalis]MCW3483054.1 hypothetical protein [Chitinophaga nivalis]